MIDLSPHTHDKTADPVEVGPIPRHDPAGDRPEGEMAGGAFPRRFTHERAEGAIQLLSRWAGPAALVGALAVIGWLLFG